MPKYYCDYCDCYLVSSSIAVRKQHNNGAKHKANVKAYYLQFLQQATQQTIDDTVGPFRPATRACVPARSAYAETDASTGPLLPLYQCEN
jgi:U1 small nuclear ribonucleoprotein C